MACIESNGINCGNFDTTFLLLLENNIAGQHSADLVLRPERSVGQLWITCAKDEVGMKIDIEPFLKDILHIDLRHHPEVVALQRFLCRRHGGIKTHVRHLGEMIVHSGLLLALSAYLLHRAARQKDKCNLLKRVTGRASGSTI
jgi:hypothetical protein